MGVDALWTGTQVCLWFPRHTHLARCTALGWVLWGHKHDVICVFPSLCLSPSIELVMLSLQFLLTCSKQLLKTGARIKRLCPLWFHLSTVWENSGWIEKYGTFQLLLTQYLHTALWQLPTQIWVLYCILKQKCINAFGLIYVLTPHSQKNKTDFNESNHISTWKHTIRLRGELVFLDLGILTQYS